MFRGSIGVPCSVVNSRPWSTHPSALSRRSTRSLGAAVTISIKGNVSSDVAVFVGRCRSCFCTCWRCHEMSNSSVSKVDRRREAEHLTLSHPHEQDQDVMRRSREEEQSRGPHVPQGSAIGGQPRLTASRDMIDPNKRKPAL